VNAIRRTVARDRSRKGIIVTVVPAVQGKQDCRRTIRYRAERGADPLLKNVTGQRVTLVMYGDRGGGGPQGLGPSASLFCSTPGIAVQLIPGRPADSSGVVPERWPSRARLRSGPWRLRTSRHFERRSVRWGSTKPSPATRRERSVPGPSSLTIHRLASCGTGKERWLVLQEQAGDQWADVWLARDESDQTADAVAEQLALLRGHS
jgi:hypothetical protein